MRIMVLNQTPEDPTNGEYAERVIPILRSYASPGTEVDLCFPDDYPGAALSQVMNSQGIRSELDYHVSTPALIKKIVWAQQNGYDAVVQSNNFDPGVEAARFAVRIPVIGICRTSVHVAASLADRIGITVPFDHYALLTRRLLQSYGLLHHVIDIRSMALGGVPRGEQVAVQRPIIFERAVEQMRALARETGAECIVPLGGAVIPYIVSPVDLEREVGVPVLNPKAIGIYVAEMCVRGGMSQSPIAYPAPRLVAEDFEAFAHAPAGAGRA
ncbi:MAG TPA: aspartate/glutamate racemase family protein [Chloroflexota bacterium]|nr:aspartate/glutamate racemase family protein [Chloroflexota bacterium]